MGKDKHPGGRPTKYKAEYCTQAEKLCKLGAIDLDLADFFDVSEATIYNWKNEHPEFLEALGENKTYSDKKVKQSLYHRALGYSHPETHISVFQGEVIKTETIKHYPPDTNAALKWLYNRVPEEWRDKNETVLTTIDEEGKETGFKFVDGPVKNGDS